MKTLLFAFLFAFIGDAAFLPHEGKRPVASSVEFESCEASRRAETIYSDYRNKYPFHYQTVGVAEFPDRSALILISEPSPTVTEHSLRQLFSGLDHSLQVRKHKLGYDGFITDVLVVLNAVSHDQVGRMVEEIHEQMFSSPYKAEKSTLQLPVSRGRQFFSENNLNFQISLAELHDWFIVKKELFLAADDRKVTMATLLKDSRPGVYLSDSPGFVAWVIDKQQDLARQKSSIREFVLDSDILLGAFASADRLVVIGRERVASLSEMPPLCTETILKLASCPTPQLSQSLDINDILAGKIINRSIDWSPTYLSDELENSEYGDLLTITDLLLKEWTESGEMRNLDFSYPVPSGFPFAKPLSTILAEKEEQGRKVNASSPISFFSYTLVYNWNTDDAVYSLRFPDYSVYAVSNTGALPVSYFNDQYSALSIGKEFEKKAYGYFANSSSTDLARVVQYQTLYSLFFDNLVFQSTPSPSYPRNAKPYLLEKYAAMVLKGLRDMSPEDKRTLAHRIAQEVVSRQDDSALKDEIKRARRQLEEDIDREIRREGVSKSDPRAEQFRTMNMREFEEDVKKWLLENKDAWISQYEARITPEIDEVQQLLRGLSEKEFSQICRYMSYPRGNQRVGAVLEEKAIRLQKGITSLSLSGIYKTVVYESFGVDLGEVMDYYGRSLNHFNSTWIKTPTLTRTFGGYHAVGGHNLSARLKVVRSLTEYVPVSISSNKVIEARLRQDVIPSSYRDHRGL